MYEQLNQSRDLYIPEIGKLKEVAAEYAKHNVRIGAEPTRLAMIDDEELNKIVSPYKRRSISKLYTPFRLEFLDDGSTKVGELTLSDEPYCFTFGVIKKIPELFRSNENDEEKEFEYLDTNVGIGVEPDGNILATHNNLLPEGILNGHSMVTPLAMRRVYQSGVIQELTGQITAQLHSV